VSVSAIVLAYITSHPVVGIPVIGPLSQEQLRDSLAGADLTLTPEQLRYLVDGEEGDAA
jgi:aryl-alcohol dehydrogenase-like predicted oxidoreductase